MSQAAVAIRKNRGAVNMVPESQMGGSAGSQAPSAKLERKATEEVHSALGHRTSRASQGTGSLGEAEGKSGERMWGTIKRRRGGGACGDGDLPNAGFDVLQLVVPDLGRFGRDRHSR